MTNPKPHIPNKGGAQSLFTAPSTKHHTKSSTHAPICPEKITQFQKQVFEKTVQTMFLFIRDWEAPLSNKYLMNHFKIQSPQVQASIFKLLSRSKKLRFDKDNGTWDYLNKWNVRTPIELLVLLGKTRKTNPGGHFKICDFQEGWSGYLESIDALCQLGFIEVLRDSSPQQNPVGVRMHIGSTFNPCMLKDREFVDFWVNYPTERKRPLPKPQWQPELDKYVESLLRNIDTQNGV